MQNGGDEVDIFVGGVSSLAAQLDKTVMVVLRDGRHIIGSLSTFDQYGNLVLERSKERHFAQGKYCDIDMGVYLIRGENITLLGEVDVAIDAANPLMQLASWEEVRALEEEAEAKEKTSKADVGAASGSGEGGVRAGWAME